MLHQAIRAEIDHLQHYLASPSDLIDGTDTCCRASGNIPHTPWVLSLAQKISDKTAQRPTAVLAQPGGLSSLSQLRLLSIATHTAASCLVNFEKFIRCTSPILSSAGVCFTTFAPSPEISRRMGIGMFGGGRIFTG